LHHLNGLYKIIDFAFNKNAATSSDFFVIYQPQYKSSKFGNNILFALEINKFFEDTHYKNKLIPKFKHLGNSKEQVKQNVRDISLIIKPSPIYKTESILSYEIENLTFEDYVIKGFAKHAETHETQIIYTKPNLLLLAIISPDKFFEQSNIKPHIPTIAKYMTEFFKGKTKNIL